MAEIRQVALILSVLRARAFQCGCSRAGRGGNMAAPRLQHGGREAPVAPLGVSNSKIKYKTRIFCFLFDLLAVISSILSQERRQITYYKCIEGTTLGETF